MNKAKGALLPTPTGARNRNATPDRGLRDLARYRHRNRQSPLRRDGMQR